MRCISPAGSGKTSLLEGRKGLAVDDSSVKSPGETGLAHLLSSALFDLLEEKQVDTGLACILHLQMPQLPTDHHHQIMIVLAAVNKLTKVFLSLQSASEHTCINSNSSCCCCCCCATSLCVVASLNTASKCTACAAVMAPVISGPPQPAAVALC